MPFPTEKELVDSAIKHFPLRKWLQVNEHDEVFLGTEVQGLFGIPDLVAAIPPHQSNVDGSPVLTMAFEMKLSDWLRGLAQAFRYRTFANSSFLVIDEARSKRAVANLERFQRANVGLIGLKADGSFLMGVATLERRPRQLGIGGADPDRCGIASSHQSRLRGRWLGVGRWPPPSARSSACRNVPCDL